MTPRQQEALRLKESGASRKEIAAHLECSESNVKRLLEKARSWIRSDPSIQEAAIAANMDSPDDLRHFWKKTDEYSLFIKNTKAPEAYDMVRQALEDHKEDGALTYEPRPYNDKSGEHLLVIDLADVHFGKLAVRTETGFTYNRDVARHRVIEGTKALLRMSSGFGINRVLFVLGNDMLHTDSPRGFTTSGTPQDTDGSIFQMFSDARAAMVGSIKECALTADVDLLHCMSNHDWVTGWTLSQAVGAGFDTWPTVSATPYNMSENHRKYYRYGNNLLGLTHADGAKEEALYGLMVQEARHHVGECTNLYWILHHYHHKTKKRRGQLAGAFMSEKDHGAMSVMHVGSPKIEGVGCDIEYVRSPSAPDGWHHRNGYINRQAVECFIYHPEDGQKARFTEWF